MNDKNRIVNFGISKVLDKSNNSASYKSKKWTELSCETSIIMYETRPGTNKPVDLPSKNLNLSNMLLPIHLVEDEICDHCNTPLKDHELNSEFINKIKKREKNQPVRIKNIQSLLINQ